MCPGLIEIGSKTAEKNSAQTNRQTDTTKIMVTSLGREPIDDNIDTTAKQVAMVWACVVIRRH